MVESFEGPAITNNRGRNQGLPLRAEFLSQLQAEMHSLPEPFPISERLVSLSDQIAFGDPTGAAHSPAYTTPRALNKLQMKGLRRTSWNAGGRA